MHGGVTGHRLLLRQAVIFRQRRGDAFKLCRDGFTGLLMRSAGLFAGNHYLYELFIAAAACAGGRAGRNPFLAIAECRYRPGDVRLFL